MGRAFLVLLVLLAVWLLWAGPPPVVSCPCDHSRPETLKPRVCSLCGTAEKQTDEIYFLKDINPHKPNRYLALPQCHEDPTRAEALLHLGRVLELLGETKEAIAALTEALELAPDLKPARKALKRLEGGEG